MKRIFLLLVFVMAVAALNAQQRTSIKAGDLPKSISDYITKDYSGFAISQATKVDVNNMITYETVITKGSMRDVLSFDSNGKFLKKIEAGSGMKKMGHSGSMHKAPNKK
jgi:hypothetical protein